MIHKSDKIKFILKRQFPDALIGSEMSFLGEAETRVYGELSNLPLEELDKQYREQKELHAAEMAARQRRDDQASFFNMPSAAADFDFWTKCPTWTVDETVALILGKDPTKVATSTLWDVPTSSPFREKFKKLHELVKRMVAEEQIADPIRPSEFVALAHRIGLELPSELQNLSKPSITDHGVLGARERDSLLKMIIGMAVIGYRFDPKARSGATKDIADDLHLAGVPLDPDTIRKWLKEAAELLPPSETE